MIDNLAGQIAVMSAQLAQAQATCVALDKALDETDDDTVDAQVTPGV